VSHDGVIQKPGTDYTLASGGTQITFTTAPASGASIFIVEISGAVGGPLDADLNGTELILDADGDTSLHASTDDQIDIKIAGADDFQFTANTFTAASGSTIAAQALTATTLTATGAVSLNGGSFVFNEDSADVDFRVEGNGDTHAIFMNGELDHVNFGSSDASLYQVDIKDATAFDPSSNTANSAPLRVRSSATTGNLGAIAIGGNNNNGIFNSGNNEIALQGYSTIKFFCSNTNDDKFGTKTERMRIASNGEVSVNDGQVATGAAVFKIKGALNNDVGIITHGTSSSTSETLFRFRDGANEDCGTISINPNSNSVAYNTSSDYRLKENESVISDGITRLKQLKPYRFNFKSDSEKTVVDGFFAHEVSSIVPEAISGEKDAFEKYREHQERPEDKNVGDFKLDENGEKIPEYQQIDQAKLVPLLTAALKEAITEIESLKARVTTLEG
jgi:hypothetical protein